MKERPLLFSAPMVRALLAGTKTQTRRIVKPQPHPAGGLGARPDDMFWQLRVGSGIVSNRSHAPADFVRDACPYGEPGDRLWVRETWAHHIHAACAHRDEEGPFVYAADGESALRNRFPQKWTPAIHMFRWASRISLEITEVRVERLQAISEDDADAEGITGPLAAELRSTTPSLYLSGPAGICAYARLWESLNGPGSWEANPWVWVVEFKRLEQGQ